MPIQSGTVKNICKLTPSYDVNLHEFSYLNQLDANIIRVIYVTNFYLFIFDVFILRVNTIEKNIPVEAVER